MLRFIPCIKKEEPLLSSSYDEEQNLLKKETGNSKEKTIGLVGGVSLLINNITGPAMVTIPLLYQSAGWFTPTLCLVLMSVLGTLASAFLCEAMASLPGNHQFEGRIEFSTLVNFYFGKRGLILAQLFINISLQCANVASIIECSQVADETLIAIFKRSCGLQLYPHLGWQCVDHQIPSDSPFEADAYYLFTIGFIIMMIIVIPMGLLNLDDNIYIQVLADVFLVVVTVDFVVTFFMHGIDFSRVPMFKGGGQSAVLGMIMANYAFVTTVPSWCSEKKKEVSVNKSLWAATTTSTLTFFVLGYLGALSFTFPASGNILSVINASAYSNTFTKVLVYLFPIMVLATTIPVFSIIVRYNLLQSKMHKGVANFFAVVLPWLVVIPFLTGDGLDQIINWGTIFFTSVANFIIPFVVYIKACSFKNNPNQPLNETQKEILLGLGIMPKSIGYINDLEEEQEEAYEALPKRVTKYVSAKHVATVSASILFVLVIAGIVLNIVSVV